MTGRVRVAVVGVGHFGAYHADKVAALATAELVAVADRDPARAQAVAAKHGVRWATDYRSLASDVDAVSVTVPTVAHEEVAAAFLAAGKHVLVEKPIAHDLPAARRLIALAAARGVVLQVGHLPRFYGVVAALKEKLGRPLFIDAVRIAPFKPRGTDVNVILDLMVHDLDLIAALVDAPLVAVDAAGAAVISGFEDIANARLKFATGCVATMTASRISLKTERKMRIFQDDAYLTVDFDQRTIRVIRKKAGELAPGIPNVEIEDRVYEDGDPLAAEIASFIAAIQGGTPPLVSGEDGLRALEGAIRVNDALKEHAAFVARARG